MLVWMCPLLQVLGLAAVGMNTNKAAQAIH